MIVLDTNVVFESMRPQPDATLRSWLNSQAAETLYISSVTLAELLFGIGVLPSGARKARLELALDGLLELFPGRILPFDQDAARRYAEMAIAGREAGRPLAMADGYIAATAASRGFSVTTRNTRDFQGTGVSIVNPWETH